jgi:nucleoside 2-deoxyribosyltransferase-like protein
MAKVITAPERLPKPKAGSWSAFLAGAIDMGVAVDWQAWVIEQLSNQHDVLLFNPRRQAFTADTLDEQIYWELDALEAADTVFMWFPKDAKAPISFFEAGLYWRSGKLIVGAEAGFYRRRNLELTGDRYDVPIYLTLESMITALLTKMRSVGFHVIVQGKV